MPTTPASPSTWPPPSATSRSTLDVAARRPRRPDRSRLREVFREFELREPLRRLEEALGSADEAAPAPVAERRCSAAVREGRLADVEALPPTPRSSVAVRVPDTPEGALFGENQQWRFGAYAAAAERHRRRRRSPRGSRRRRSAPARSSPTTPSRSARCPPPRPRHCGRRLPARAARRAATRSGSCARIAAWPPISTRVPAADARLVAALAEWQREEIRSRGLTDLLQRGRAAARCASCATWRRPGVKLDTAAPQEISARVKAEADQLEREIFDLAGEEFTLGSPRQLEEVLFGKLGLSRKQRGKTGYSTDAQVLQPIRAEHEIIPKIERYRELTKLAQTYLDALPPLVDAGQPPAHDLQPDRGHHRAPVLQQPQPPEHPDPHRAGPRDPRLLRRRARQPARLRRLLTGRAAPAGPHRRRGCAQGDLPPRRGRAHRDRLPGVRRPARRDRPRACARRPR